MPRILILILSYLFFFLSLNVQADEFASSKGFTISYPKGWVILTKEQQDKINDAAEALLNKMNLTRDVLDRIAVYIINPRENGFKENINVIIQNGSMPINKDTEKELRKELTSHFEKAGISTGEIQITQCTFGNKEGISLQYEMNTQFGETKIWQVSFPGNNQTYIVTCTSDVSDFDKVYPIFLDTLNNLKIDTGIHSIPNWLLYAFIGAIIGAIISAINSINRKKKMEKEKLQTMAPPSSPAAD